MGLLMSSVRPWCVKAFGVGIGSPDSGLAFSARPLSPNDVVNREVMRVHEFLGHDPRGIGLFGRRPVSHAGSQELAYSFDDLLGFGAVHVYLNIEGR
jgi:hypothetical protein